MATPTDHWHYATLAPEGPTTGAMMYRPQISPTGENLSRTEAKAALIPLLKQFADSSARYETPLGELVAPSRWWMQHEPLQWLSLGAHIPGLVAVFHCNGHCGDSAMDWVAEASEAIGQHIPTETVDVPSYPPE